MVREEGLEGKVREGGLGEVVWRTGRNGKRKGAERKLDWSEDWQGK